MRDEVLEAALDDARKIVHEAETWTHGSEALEPPRIEVLRLARAVLSQHTRIRELEAALGEALNGLDSEIDADRIAELRKLLEGK